MIDNNKIIHLFITSTCTHTCKFCCNKQYDIDEIPVVSVSELKYAGTVLLTGGEPFLFIDIDRWAKRIKVQFPNVRNIYVYTCGDSLYQYLDRGGRLDSIDGVNISPKGLQDFFHIRGMLSNSSMSEKIKGLSSNRLYIFPEGERNYILIKDIEEYPNFQIFHREWQEEFVPQSGIFRRLPIFF